MTTPVFDGFLTNAEVSAPEYGSRPAFGRKDFDSKGHEKKVVVAKDGEVGQKKEEEQSFFTKYWFPLLAAFLILPRLLEVPQDGGSPA